MLIFDKWGFAINFIIQLVAIMAKEKIVIVLISVLLVISCETTKLVYNSKTNTELTRLGVADLNKKSPKLDSIFPKLDSNFIASSIKYSNRFLAKETIYLNQKLSCHQPDTLKIIDLCLKNNLDGIILTYVEFTRVITQVYFITIDKHIECTLYSKIYNKKGKMLYSVVHDSKNDSYEKIPNTYDVVNLAAGISYKKIYTTRQKK
jgi:hypothetical protein